MKQTIKMSRAVGQIEKMYRALNEDFFRGELPTPIITIQSKPGTWGHCSVSRIWKIKEEDAYEMNIAAEVANREIEELIDTLLHEMVHLYCRENDIKETSRGGGYHNGKFKELAEYVGLVCIKTEKNGWNTQGIGNDRLIEYALSKGWSELEIGRRTAGIPFGLMFPGGTESGETQTTPPRRPSSTRKLQCPCCKNSVRATKTVRVMCMDCNQQMMEVCI